MIKTMTGQDVLNGNSEIMSLKPLQLTEMIQFADRDNV
jgi:hypothetical protein